MSRWRSKLVMLGGESPYAELYRSLRAQLDYAAVDRSVGIIAVVAPHRGNGATETAANLAVAYAQAGKKTLLVDSDLHDPMHHKLLNISNVLGFSGVLDCSARTDEAVQSDIMPNLSVLTAGSRPAVAANLVTVSRLRPLLEKWRDEYDIVLLDTPPLLTSADAQTLVSACDGALLVLRSGTVKEEDAVRVKELLTSAEVPIMGTALTHKRRRMLPSRYGGR